MQTGTDLDRWKFLWTTIVRVVAETTLCVRQTKSIISFSIDTHAVRGI